MSVIHSLDHMQRLHERCEEDIDRADAARHTPELDEYIQMVSHQLNAIINDIAANRWHLAKASALTSCFLGNPSRYSGKVVCKVR